MLAPYNQQNYFKKSELQWTQKKIRNAIMKLLTLFIYKTVQNWPLVNLYSLSNIHCQEKLTIQGMNIEIYINGNYVFHSALNDH